MTDRLTATQELIAPLVGSQWVKAPEIPSKYQDYLTQFARQAELSEADQALWTNRVPMHEPWPRVLKGQPQKDPAATQQYDDDSNMYYQDQVPPQRYNLNRHHDNEFSDDSAWVGRADGDQPIERNPSWRR